jgi:hypothetical protein
MAFASLTFSSALSVRVQWIRAYREVAGAVPVLRFQESTEPQKTQGHDPRAGSLFFAHKPL